MLCECFDIFFGSLRKSKKETQMNISNTSSFYIIIYLYFSPSQPRWWVLVPETPKSMVFKVMICKSVPLVPFTCYRPFHKVPCFSK